MQTYIKFLTSIYFRSEKCFKTNAKIISSSGLSILANIQFFILDFKSGSEKSTELSGLIEFIIRYLLNCSAKLNSE